MQTNKNAKLYSVELYEHKCSTVIETIRVAKKFLWLDKGWLRMIKPEKTTRNAPTKYEVYRVEVQWSQRLTCIIHYYIIYCQDYYENM